MRHQTEGDRLNPEVTRPLKIRASAMTSGY